MTTEKVEAFIYLCKYENKKPFIQVDGDRKILVEMLIDAINSDALFFEAIDYCAKQNGYGMEQ